MKIRGIDNFRFVLIIVGITVLPIVNSCFADMLDQSSTSGNIDGTLGLPDNAQTFTVGLAGILSQIHVEVERHLNSDLDLVMDLRNTTAGGAPIENDGAVLATTTIATSSFPVLNTPTWIEWDVESSGISVDVGDVLAIVLRVDTTNPANYFWQSSASNPYAGGQRWTRSLTWAGGVLGVGWNGTYAANETSDMNFRTFVVPAPGAVLLGMLGLSLAGVKLRKHA